MGSKLPLGLKKKLPNFLNLKAFERVPKVGIEPTHLAVHDFESCASTNSAILAWGCKYA